MFSLMILRRIEAIFRSKHAKPDLMLRDCFDFFAGSSTGAIIATTLALGWSVEEVLDLYQNRGAEMFIRSAWIDRKDNTYDAGPLEAIFREHVGDESLGTAALWRTDDTLQQKVLLVIMRNASTGSAWPVCNHPAAKYNAPDHPDCNLRVPLWQLLRGSTAAPTFFRPQEIRFGARAELFVDGGMTPYNNPAFIAALMATLPAYRINWPVGPQQLQVVSIGTGMQRTTLHRRRYIPMINVGFLDSVEFAAKALLDAAAMEQDLFCRLLGECRFGRTMDRELADLSGGSLLLPTEKKFSYVRYDHRFQPAEITAIEQRTGKPFDMANVGLIPELVALGEAYAAEHVQAEHFFL